MGQQPEGEIEMMSLLNVTLAILFSVLVLVGMGQLVSAPADVLEVEASALVVKDEPAKIETAADEEVFQLTGVFNRRLSCDDGSCGTTTEKPADGFLPTPPPTPPVVEEDEQVVEAGPVAKVGAGAARCVGKAVCGVGKIARAVIGRERRQARRASR